MTRFALLALVCLYPYVFGFLWLRRHEAHMARGAQVEAVAALVGAEMRGGCEGIDACEVFLCRRAVAARAAQGGTRLREYASEAAHLGASIG